jgi:hydroxymethylpyrimidine/phosphomethylpyrimidine kinase
METAARIIRDLGPDEVLIKGGHLAGRPVDLLFKGTRSHLLDGPRIETEGAHGTGCVFSAALATFLGQGMESYPAAVRAKDFTTGAISRAVRLGAGGPSADPFAHAALFTERESVLEALRTALDRLLSQPLAHLVPEIRSNLGFALPQASRTEDVAAVQGRITTLGRRLLALSEPAFGASRHVARVILAAMSANPCLRSAMNIRYSPEIVQVCQALGFPTVCFERSAEPEAVKAREGSTLTWGTRRALEGGQGTADVVYDLGEVGKEPVIRVLGTDPGQVVEKVIRIHEALVEAGRA